MKWNKIKRWRAVKKIAEHSKVVAGDLEKHSSPEYRLNPVVQDKKLTVTFDLTLPIFPQIDLALTEARWGQRNLKLKMKREKPPLSDQEFEQGLEVVTMHSEGKSFQEIGDFLWPRDKSAGSSKTKAYRKYYRLLTSLSPPRLPRPRIRP